jgi:hypothetical protein
METQQILELLLARLDAYTKATEGMKFAMQSMRSEIENTREETMACQEKTEARLEGEEPTSVDMEPDVAHQEVPREDAAIMPVGVRRKRRRDRKLAA